MNAVQIAINRATREIPRMILEDCFIRRYQDYRQIPKSIEQRIKEEVILKVVLPDLNLTNGVWSYIPLSSAKVEQSDSNVQIYYIPKEATGGRSITTAISIGVGYPYGNLPFLGDCDNSVITRATNNLLNAISDLPITSNARVDLIAENTVMVFDGMQYPLNSSYLICILEMNENLDNIRPRSIPIFTRLIILAIKGYIFNEMNLEIDKARLIGGQDFGKYREILDSYSDAWEQYHTMLDEQIGKILYLNNKESVTRHIRSMLGGRR